MSEIRISEVFYSLQGESSFTGLPTVFIRLTGCPLRCVYCDTAYAFNGGSKRKISDLLEETRSYASPYVCVTGGEPLAQQSCLELLKSLLDSNYIVSLETSGALDVSQVDARVIKVMDLKTPSSGELHRNLWSNLHYLQKRDQLKFVIGNEEDYAWSVSVMQEHQLAEKCQILFSPMVGYVQPAWLADKILADRLPVRFQIQLHKYLWGNAQGK